MKKNFVVATPTQQEYNALMYWAEKEGYKWGGGQLPTQYGGDIQQVRFEDKVLRHSATSINNEYAQVPFSTFAAIQGIELGPATVELQVGSYKATVDYQAEAVVVGCQTIPFAKVKEVYEATQQHAEQPAECLVTYEKIGELLVSFSKELRESGAPDNRYEIAKVLVRHGYQLIKK